jgi:hypothetical protein
MSQSQCHFGRKTMKIMHEPIDKVPKAVKEFAKNNACKMVRIKDTGELRKLVGFTRHGLMLEDPMLGRVFKTLPKNTKKWPVYQDSSGTWWLTCQAHEGHSFLVSQVEPCQ